MKFKTGQPAPRRGLRRAQAIPLACEYVIAGAVDLSQFDLGYQDMPLGFGPIRE